jgi:DNA-directed RNA polymerase specialized sigma24 family protein
MENPELVGALKKLSPEQQRATVLHYGHQMSFSEMSVMSGRSLKEEYRDARMGLEKLRRDFSLHKKA